MDRAETWRDAVELWSYRRLEDAAMALPERIGRAAAVVLGDAAWLGMRRARATVAANQARALGLDRGDARVRRATREAFELAARYWYDTFRIRALEPALINARTEVVGLHHVDAALAKGAGCLTVLPHMGNWDLAGRFLAVNGYRIAAVTEELRPAGVSELLRRHRTELGLRVLPFAAGARVPRQLVRLLSENWVVALLADRVLRGRGVEVEMFGARRRVPSGPAALSLATGAALLVCAAYTTPNGWRVEAGAPLEIAPSGDRRADVRELSQRMATAFERAIAVRPPDWQLFQPGWDEAARAARP